MTLAFIMVCSVNQVLADRDLSPRDRFELLFGETLGASRMGTQSGMLWVNYCEAYMARLDARSKNAVWKETCRRTIRWFTVSRNLFDKRVHEVTQADFAAYISERRLRGKRLSDGTFTQLSVPSLNNDIGILNGLFAYAGPRLPVRGHRENLGLIQDVPYIEQFREPDPLPVCVTDDQLAAFVGAIPLAKTPHPLVCDPKLFWSCVLALDAVTALRRGALLGVKRPSDRDLLEQRVLPVEHGIMKNARAEKLSLGDDDRLAKMLYLLPSREGEPLLPWKRLDGRPLGLSHFNYVMKQIQLKAGVDPAACLRTKHLRSTAATKLIEEQFSTDVARKRLGHRSEGVINKHYVARQTTKADRAASNCLSAMVMPLIDPSVFIHSGVATPNEIR